jgi:hypothetical protein
VCLGCTGWYKLDTHPLTSESLITQLWVPRLINTHLLSLLAVAKIIIIEVLLALTCAAECWYQTACKVAWCNIDARNTTSCAVRQTSIASSTVGGRAWLVHRSVQDMQGLFCLPRWNSTRPGMGG